MSAHKVGAIVRLNSGGPRMRVVTADATHAVCEWMTPVGKTCGTFPHACLTPVSNAGVN